MFSSSSSSHLILPPLLATMFLAAIHQANGQYLGYGAASLMGNGVVPSTSDFQALYNGNFHGFMCMIYNGTLVPDAASYNYTDFQAGINQTCIRALNNAKAARNCLKATPAAPLCYTAPPGKLEGFMVAKWIASNATATYNGTSWDPIKLQIKVMLDALNAGCTPPCVLRCWLMVLQVYDGISIASLSSNQTDNQRFVSQYLSYWPAYSNLSIGVLTNNSDWQALMPASYVPADSNNQPPVLWLFYPLQCTQQTPFVPFGAWTSSRGPSQCTMAINNTNQNNIYCGDQNAYNA